ncbi:hypothetical protein TspCOW1_12930 [Thiohalobacter sp. COW1]|nr:hypothetical protein TspCOW1_12930 [Thiohalobacter sp. COW1]
MLGRVSLRPDLGVYFLGSHMLDLILFHPLMELAAAVQCFKYDSQRHTYKTGDKSGLKPFEQGSNAAVDIVYVKSEQTDNDTDKGTQNAE